jgi:hypothetical protein
VIDIPKIPGPAVQRQGRPGGLFTSQLTIRDLAQIDASTARHMWNVSFHERRLTVVSTSGDRYHYRHLYMPDYAGYGGVPGFRLVHVPQVGDLVHLHYVDEGVTPGRTLVGTFQVVQRAWHYSAFGSANWPLGEPIPRCPGGVDVITERADGPFVNDNTPTEEDSDGS